MSKSRFKSLLFIFLLMISVSAQAHVSIIISLPPPAREIVVEPAGYSNCYVYPAGFYNGVWNYPHRVCEYNRNPEVRIWVAGYWQCPRYLSNGVCTHRVWIRNHWARHGEREYNGYAHHHYYHSDHSSHYRHRYY